MRSALGRRSLVLCLEIFLDSGPEPFEFAPHVRSEMMAKKWGTQPPLASCRAKRFYGCEERRQLEDNKGGDR
jgi:hypothetical protein